MSRLNCLETIYKETISPGEEMSCNAKNSSQLVWTVSKALLISNRMKLTLKLTANSFCIRCSLNKRLNVAEPDGRNPKRKVKRELDRNYFNK